jgi:hypothetical protein
MLFFIWLEIITTVLVFFEIESSTSRLSHKAAGSACDEPLYSPPWKLPEIKAQQFRPSLEATTLKCVVQVYEHLIIPRRAILRLKA